MKKSQTGVGKGLSPFYDILPYEIPFFKGSKMIMMLMRKMLMMQVQVTKVIMMMKVMVVLMMRIDNIFN